MRKTLMVVLAALLLGVAAPATASAGGRIGDPIDTDPVPAPALCHQVLGLEPPPPGELPVIQDPVVGESVGVACAPESDESFTNAEITVTNEVTTWGAERNGNNGPLTGQVQIVTKIAPAGVGTGDVLQGGSVTYKVTVRVAGQPDRTETVVVAADRAVGAGAVGGYRNTTFNPPIPAKARVSVELVSGTGWVQFNGMGNPRQFNIKAADHGTQDFPEK